MRTFKSIIAVTLLIVVAASCNKKLDVTGVWTCTTTEKTDNNNLFMQMQTWTLTNDGEFTEEIIIQNGILNLSTTGRGTYRVSNDSIIATIKNVHVNGEETPFKVIEDNIKRKILKVDKDSLVYMQDNKITRMKRK